MNPIYDHKVFNQYLTTVPQIPSWEDYVEFALQLGIFTEADEVIAKAKK